MTTKTTSESSTKVVQDARANFVLEQLETEKLRTEVVEMLQARRKPVVKTTVDKEWFTTLMGEHSYSLRKLAGAIGLDPSALSLMLDGKRKMSVEEAGSLAVLLRAPVEEVIKRAGVKVQVDFQSLVRLSGWVDPLGLVHQGEKGLMGPNVANAPFATRSTTEALRCQGGRWDGWVLFFNGPGKAQGVGADAVDRLCVVELGGPALRQVCWLKRGYEEGMWNLVPLEDGPTEVSRVKSAVPVLWMKQ